jgi:putative transposase
MLSNGLNLVLVFQIFAVDGRGAWRDKVFVERVWRSIKYERVYLRAYDSVSAARTDVA